MTRQPPQQVPSFFRSAARHFLNKHAEDALLRNQVSRTLLQKVLDPLKALFESKQDLAPMDPSVAPDVGTESVINSQKPSTSDLTSDLIGPSDHLITNSLPTPTPATVLPVDAEAPQGTLPVPHSKAKTHKAQGVQELAETQPEPGLDESPKTLI